MSLFNIQSVPVLIWETPEAVRASKNDGTYLFQDTLKNELIFPFVGKTQRRIIITDTIRP